MDFYYFRFLKMLFPEFYKYNKFYFILKFWINIHKYFKIFINFKNKNVKYYKIFLLIG